jgi:hypothetical protein
MSDKTKLAVVWGLLALITAVAGIMHQYSSIMLASTIATEFALYAILAYAFFKPSSTVSIISLVASIVWLLNQFGWNVTGVPWSNTIAIIYAFIATFLLALVVYMNYAKTTVSMDIGKKEGMQILLLSMFVMIVNMGDKLYLDIVGYSSWGVGALSGALWAFGILLMVFGSIISMFSTTSLTKGYSMGFMLAVVGLVIASYAAIVYGIALSVV